jgi:hypothetical protein
MFKLRRDRRIVTAWRTADPVRSGHWEVFHRSGRAHHILLSSRKSMERIAVCAGFDVGRYPSSIN